jgi:hypothetical protein
MLLHTHIHIYMLRVSLSARIVESRSDRSTDKKFFHPGSHCSTDSVEGKVFSEMIFIRPSNILACFSYSILTFSSCSWCQWAASFRRPAIAHRFRIHPSPVSALIVGGCCLHCSSSSSSTDRRWLLLRHPPLSGNKTSKIQRFLLIFSESNWWRSSTNM